jgi:putative tryptophan/tyrosine transport system substrate-binding protein
MNEKAPCLALGALLLALSVSAEAQQPTKVPRIEYQSAGSSGEREEAFRQGLRQLGYVEGRTSSLSGDLRKESPIRSHEMRRSWSG